MYLLFINYEDYFKMVHSHLYSQYLYINTFDYFYLYQFIVINLKLYKINLRIHDHLYYFKSNMSYLFRNTIF